MPKSLYVPLPALLLLALALGACARDDAPPGRAVVLATTTSVEDTGLLDELSAGLRRDHPDISLRVVAVGSGQALTLARRGDADLVLVHDPAAESAFVAGGHGDARRTIMRNDFVVVGPDADPAGVREAADPFDALRRIAHARAPFLSRGDSSGTHRKERALWRGAALEPAGDWYRAAGVGQADLLRMASERQAYALVDRGTFRYLEHQVDLAVVHADGPILDNPYSVIVATRSAEAAGVRAVADWLSGDAARAIIMRYGTDRFGTPLFEVVP